MGSPFETIKVDKHCPKCSGWGCVFCMEKEYRTVEIDVDGMIQANLMACCAYAISDMEPGESVKEALREAVEKHNKIWGPRT